jgi:hypothetical protein
VELADPAGAVWLAEEIVSTNLTSFSGEVQELTRIQPVASQFSSINMLVFVCEEKYAVESYFS